MAEPNLASRAVSNVAHAHNGWCIVAMGTTLQLTTNFVSQAFAILVVFLIASCSGGKPYSISVISADR